MLQVVITLVVLATALLVMISLSDSVVRYTSAVKSLRQRAVGSAPVFAHDIRKTKPVLRPLAVNRSVARFSQVERVAA